ncbi:MAG: DNA-directed RNA polymerase subunit beta [Flavobacteriaceae bacterium]|nr:DNA-directed RNA polymerase subunit beta [Flavobacteriaceae bacterium]MCY4215624.1 DNA-directed RNA polymerase subunit beta [Flavobacteriaceae bacterium]MCY4254454.1 DNA-directed RNA polymerase subunit beta [Flavobacteriaceae bacterium]
MSSNKNGRIQFSRVEHIPEYPDFLDVQLKSFRDFFQLDAKPENRVEEGLYKTFKDNFPIKDSREQSVLEFVDYFVDPPRFGIKECIEGGLTYSVLLKARLRLTREESDGENFPPMTQDVYLGKIPYMTPSGTFVINGAQRVVVSQLHRSPGVFFGQSVHTNGKVLYNARVIPFKGSWIEFASDVNSVMYAYIDRKKKVPITTLLKAIGYETDHDIFEEFDIAEKVKVSKTALKRVLNRKLAAPVLKSWVEDFVDEDTAEVVSITRNEVVIGRNEILVKDHIEKILNVGTKEILLHKEGITDNAIIFNTLERDPTNTQGEALEYIYRQLRNADAPDEATAKDTLNKLFFSNQRYNLGDVGRFKMNQKLGLDIHPETLVLTNQDIIQIIKILIELINSKAEVDDIDHLSNRRVRTVGEQLSSQFGVGLSRMARTIKERMNVRDNEEFTPSDLINSKTITSVINSFFGTSQLSQFMDQTNPLAEITHKRRLSALGPGGLSRERAGFEVRDIHYTHYGRICPIESPEGPNIGLISSLSVFAKINKLGFIETPYRKVDEGKVDLENIHYLAADEEENRNQSDEVKSKDQLDEEKGYAGERRALNFGRANVSLKDDGTIDQNRVVVRRQTEFPEIDPNEVDFLEIAPNQIASISTSLIPFIEHDDANRALMGSNMMRQAVPLIKPEAPIVGTGLERKVATDSRVLLNAERDGEVQYVDADKIVVKYEYSPNEKLIDFDGDIKTYPLTKFQRTNYGSCINLRSIVKKGDKIKKGQVLTQGYATVNGELALGRNLKVAFMSWKGYNFEDAIVISERVVRDDILTSIHIDELYLDVRDTKLGAEELTRDIPNVSEEATKDLDEGGLIRVGVEVKPGDILIGKITPKGESDPTPEEKLLRAIFGEKAGDVKDASLKTPPSTFGTVIDTKVFSRSTKERWSQAKEDIQKLNEQYDEQQDELRQVLIEKLYSILKGKKSQGIYRENGDEDETIPKGKSITRADLERIMDYTQIEGRWVFSQKTNQLIDDILHNYKIKNKDIEGSRKRQEDAIRVGDELQSGVKQRAKVYIAKKRKLKVGDKMAGRHGNKGIVAKIVRQEDMPFLEDGTPVDIVLNPLGVPSRMNLGQIYETVLGWAGQKLDHTYATSIFDGAKMDQINELTDHAEIPRLGHTYLYDGGTGERFDQKATVGVIYMLKLGHMVDDKLHSRSIGPYSLITQQPLGGKAQSGGQRFGEMEVWALEAYGASKTLQEILTVKSDDVVGRAKTYEAITKGESLPEPGLPESFNVLMHELKGLGIDIRLEE